MCWKLIIHNYKKELILSKDYSTLSQIGEELGYTYNVVNDMVRGRKQPSKGRYDSQYLIIRLDNEVELTGEVIIE
mgnify:FL=1|tara:strand:- start:18 stop:242 length:225 start_codon:yes stop_codon:yes gene_type:complete